MKSYLKEINLLRNLKADISLISDLNSLKKRLDVFKNDSGMWLPDFDAYLHEAKTNYENGLKEILDHITSYIIAYEAEEKATSVINLITKSAPNDEFEMEVIFELNQNNGFKMPCMKLLQNSSASFN